MLELRVKRNKYQCGYCSTEFVFYREENSNQVHCALELNESGIIERCYLGSIEEEGFRLPNDDKLALFNANVDVALSKTNKDGSKDKILRDMSNEFLKPSILAIVSMPLANMVYEYYHMINILEFCNKALKYGKENIKEDTEKCLTIKEKLEKKQ